jgi:hypothetical protein
MINYQNYIFDLRLNFSAQQGALLNDECENKIIYEEEKKGGFGTIK